jgi:hypothetical protein
LAAVLREGSYQLSPEKPLLGTDKPIPHFVLDDGAFPVKRYWLRPCSRNELGDKSAMMSVQLLALQNSYRIRKLLWFAQSEISYLSKNVPTIS